MPKPTYHTFRGRRYRIRRVPRLNDAGKCDHPEAPDKEIIIRLGQRGIDELDTVLHEVGHACFWDLSEEAIGDGMTDIAKFLWREGYRRVK